MSITEIVFLILAVVALMWVLKPKCPACGARWVQSFLFTPWLKCGWCLFRWFPNHSRHFITMEAEAHIRKNRWALGP